MSGVRDKARRRHRQLAACIALLLGANVVAVYIVGNRVTPVSVDTAVARYREAERASLLASAPEVQVGEPGGPTTPVAPIVRAVGSTSDAVTAAQAPSEPAAGAPAGVVLPAPGVYVYATSGFEEVSIAGAHHTYPDQTTMTLRPAGCGLDVRWDVFNERWDRWSICTPDRRLELRQFETYHEFFGQVERRTYDCRPGTHFRPEPADPGVTTHGRCASDGATVELTTAVLAVEEVTVGSVVVPAVRVRVDEVLTGDTRGTRSSESWYALADGLLLRRTATTEVDTEAVFGSTHYSEELDLQLTSLEPRS